MVYITSDGRILESRPFGIGYIKDLFWSGINFFILYIRTLIDPELNSTNGVGSSNYRSSGGRGPPPNSGPRRRFGRPGSSSNFCSTLNDIPMSGQGG